MPETVKIPGDGEVSRRALIIGGAAAAGVLGYAWWRSGKASATPSSDTLPGSEQPTDLAPSDIGGISTGGGSTSTGAEFITSNDQWTQKAVAVMVDLGYDSVLVSEALGKYLSGQLVTQQEANWIQTAVALVGRPPVGEHSIRLAATEPSPTTSTPTPTTSPFRKTGHKYVVQLHEFTVNTPVRDAVRRFSDVAVATGNNVQVATVRTQADPRNAGKIRNGIILKQHRIYLTVVKVEPLRATG